MKIGLVVPFGELMTISGRVGGCKGIWVRLGSPLIVKSEGRESEGRDPGGCDAISVTSDNLGISVDGAVELTAPLSEPVVGLGGGAKSQGRGTIAAGMILITTSAKACPCHQRRHTM